MHLVLRVALLLAVLVPCHARAQDLQAASADDTARFLAGMQPSPGSPLGPLAQDPAWRRHAAQMDSAWDGLEENQLSKVRAWSRTNLTSRRPVTYYFFSGPDFLYADAFFPDSSTYVLAGLELTGPVPDVLKLRRRSLSAELANVRTSLGTLLKTSYFITSEMGTDLSASQLRGTLPLLFVFLARTGKTIHEVNFFELAADGTVQDDSNAKAGARGVKIIFSGTSGRRQTLYYFRTDLSNRGVQNSGFLQFCARLGGGDVFIKAASYLLHTSAFSGVRNFLLEHGSTLVQDDTGIPVAYLQKADWRLQPFGRYVGPIRMFRGHYQTKLRDLFSGSQPRPIDFGIGYRWRHNESNVLLAVNRNTATAAGSRPGAKPAAARTKPGRALPAVAASSPTLWADWRSLLLGGLVTTALVNLLGLQGLANAIGFILQTAAVGIVAWFAASYVRNRSGWFADAGLPSERERTLL